MSTAPPVAVGTAVSSAEPTLTHLVRPKRRDEAPIPLPDDDVPQETINVLGQGRDVLLRLIGAVFRAAAEIVAALLRLVQSVAGREAAETVDGRVADVLDPGRSRGGAGPDADRPGEDREATPPEADPSEPAPPEAARSEADPGLRDDVREVLLAHAETDAERSAISPAFVDMVTAGVRFVASVERQFPGAIDALHARDALERGEAATPPATSGGGAAPEAEAPPVAAREEAPPAVAF